MQISSIRFFYPKYNQVMNLQGFKDNTKPVYSTVSFRGRDEFVQTNPIKKQTAVRVPKHLKGEDITGLKQFCASSPDFAGKILYEKIRDEDGKKVPRFNPTEIETIIELHKDEPEFVEKLVSLTAVKFDETVPRFDAKQISEVYKAYKKAPEFVDKLVDEKRLNNKGVYVPKYIVAEIKKLTEFHEYNPKLVERLQAEKTYDYSGNEVSRHNVGEIGVLVALYDENPKLADRLLAKKNHNSKGQLCPVYSAYGVSKVFDIYDINPELTERFIETKMYDEYGNESTRFDGSDVEVMVLNYETAPKLTERLLSDTVTNKYKVPVPRFTAREISKIIDMMEEGDYSKKYLKELLDEKIVKPDGTEDFALQYNDISTIYTNADRSRKLNSIKNPLKPDSKLFTNKQIADLIENTLNSFDSSEMNVLKDKNLARIIANNINPNSQINMTKRNPNLDNYQIYIANPQKRQTTKIEFCVNNKKPVILGVEKASFKNGEIVSQKEFRSGEKIIEKTIYDGNVMQGYMKTLYNPDGVQIRSEVLTPLKDIPGEYTVNVYERHNGGYKKESVCTIWTSQTSDGVITRKRLTASNGTVTREAKVIGKNHFGSVYSIVAKDGTELFHTKRSHRKIDENHYESVVDGQKYDVKFDGGHVTASKINKKGKVTRRVVLGDKIYKPETSELLKSLTGDYFFKMKDAGVTSINVNKELEPGEAFYNVFNKSINLSDNLKDDTFTFAHELGHAIDFSILKKLNTDPKLRELWMNSLIDYQANSDDIEGTAIDYFMRPMGILFKKSDPIQEMIAETHALISGAPKKGTGLMLGTRSIILQQHFPDAIAYIANALTNPKEYLNNKG